MWSETEAQGILRRVRDELDFASRAVGLLDRLNPSMSEVSDTVRRLVVDLRGAMAQERTAADAVVRVAAELDATEQFSVLAGQFDSSVSNPAARAATRELLFALRSAMGISTRPRT
ncbi:hypothetical protein ACGIF2_00560 [Cellulomonas sp. P22]|uniref:hypothetical protein n=1 Tax=Cellulomonas sp. P22 TaxID=3373189 RepID=UPI0037A3492C